MGSSPWGCKSRTQLKRPSTASIFAKLSPELEVSNEVVLNLLLIIFLSELAQTQ